jgi:hypothetical protein
VTCCSCHRRGKTERLPRGWKRLAESIYCDQCWRARYTLRSIAIPVVEPMGEDWSDFREALKEGWVQTTAAANWMMTQLYIRDVRREGDEKMPPMQRAYLYPEARTRFPSLAPQTVVSIENGVQAAYRKARYEVLWTCSASLPAFRYPRPLPVHNQSWEPTLAGERPVVRVRLGGHWWQLRLKGGPRFHPQIKAYRQMVSGEAIRGELSLYRVRAHDGKLSDRPSGDQKVKFTVMCRMVAWLPRADQLQKPDEILRVATADDMLLLARNSAPISNPECVWKYHGDHLRRWAAEHRKLLQSLADDGKVHQSAPAFADRRKAAAQKYHNRTSSAIREIAAQLVSYAVRRGYGAVAYDDGARGFCPEFPYAALREQLRKKCSEAGLRFEQSFSGIDTETNLGAVVEEFKLWGHR